MALGLENCHVDINFAADSWHVAVETYNLNFQHKASEVALSWETELPSADIFVGGPPCQGFSSAGMRNPGDARNTLVAVFAHLVAQHRPAAFVFENVEGFLTGDQGSWVVDLLRPLVRAGYCVGLRKVNAANYGVPQNRKRTLVVGGLGWYPGFPDPTHRAVGAPGAEIVAPNAPPCPTVAGVLAGLPRATLNNIEGLNLLDHTYRKPNMADLERYTALKPGQTMRDLPSELWHDTYRKRAFRRVQDGTPTERRGGAPAGIRRLDPDEPSKAITSGAPSELVHPFENRTLTLRECARLQTFPDTFQFYGNKSEKALQIGNAIPPQLASSILSHITKQLQDGSIVDEQAGLFEFTATFSTGMSPALQHTLNRVNEALSPFLRGSNLQLKQLELFGGEI
ncbi:MAG: DNA cytosine methyltransferase [Acinetobacter sp.]|nr:DNA cytosine methyltransferase [Acinetobacter sp.]